MIALAMGIITILLALHHFKPEILLRQTECATLDSLRVYTFVLTGEPKETKRCLRYETEQKVLLYVLRDTTKTQPQAGDTVIAQTRIKRGGRIGDFDYGLYLRRKGIIGTAYTGNYILRKANTPPQTPLQKRLYNRLAQSGLSGDELATTGALTLGYKEDLDPELQHRFQAAGAAHVLAVSGLHTGIIYVVLMSLLTLRGRIKPRHENRLGRAAISLFVIACMWGYAWLTGMTPSVVRCVVMVTLVETGKMLYRHSPTLNTIAAAAVLILIVRPLDLWSVGFQLSFAATAAIVIFARDIETLVHRNDRRTDTKGYILSWVAGTVIISIAAQLGTLPITMYTFGQISNYFLLANLIVLPLAALLVPLGLASVALGGTFFGHVVGKITFALAWAMNHSVSWIEALPGSVTHVHTSASAHISGWMVLLLYAAMLMGWLTLHPRDKAHPAKALWWLVGVCAAMLAFCILYTL